MDHTEAKDGETINIVTNVIMTSNYTENKCYYLVAPPRAFITALHLQGMLFIKIISLSNEKPCHAAFTALQSSVTLAGFCCCSHRFSIGLKLGNCACHSIKIMTCSLNCLLTRQKVLQFALSCWNIQPSGVVGISKFSRRSIYRSWLSFPSILERQPTSLAMMLPPPCLTVVYIQLSFSSSPAILLTCTHPSLLWRSLDSSLKITWDYCSAVQSLCACANCNQDFFQGSQPFTPA